jgi:hypothetical protein
VLLLLNIFVDSHVFSDNITHKEYRDGVGKAESNHTVSAQAFAIYIGKFVFIGVLSDLTR